MDLYLRCRDFSSICRFCINNAMKNTKNSLKLHSLYDYPETSGALNIAEIFMATMPQMVISSSDGLPQVICNCCLNKLLDVQKFHQLCKESEQNLLAMMNQMNSFKYPDNECFGRDASIVKEELIIDDGIKWLQIEFSNEMKPNVSNSIIAGAIDFQPDIYNNRRTAQHIPRLLQIGGNFGMDKYADAVQHEGQLNFNGKVKRKKSSAERQREYRVRKKALLRNFATIDNTERNTNNIKTQAERSREYRARKKARMMLNSMTTTDRLGPLATATTTLMTTGSSANCLKNNQDQIDKKKAAAERQRKYRARKKAKLASVLLTQNLHSNCH